MVRKLPWYTVCCGGDSVTCQQPAGFSSFFMLRLWRNVPHENHKEEEGTDSKHYTQSTYLLVCLYVTV